MRLYVTHTPYDTSLRKQTGYIITFAQFEEGIYYMKIVTMQKAVTNPMRIQ